MKQLKMAFVDIETTGLHPKKDAIIEIAVILYDGDIIKTWHSLLQSEVAVPPSIEKLTGIGSEMLKNQPSFKDIASCLHEMLEGCVLVAHNVRFDYSFLKHQFKRHGYDFAPKQLCTLKLSKTLFPKQKSHRLSHIVAQHQLNAIAEHRALADVFAIYQFWRHLEQHIESDALAQTCLSLMKRPSLPNQLQIDWDKVHNGYGVYLIYGDNDLPIYIGKSKHVKTRLLSHFSQDIHDFKEMRLSQQAKRLEVLVCEGETDALITESLLIKKLQPLLNRKLRRQKHLFTWCLVRNEEGYQGLKLVNAQTLNASKSATESQYFGLFHSQKEAWNWALALFEKSQVCLQVLGLEKGKMGKPCFRYQLKYCQGACVRNTIAQEHNRMVDDILHQEKIINWPFSEPAVLAEGQIWHVIDHWVYLGKAKTVEEIEPLLLQKKGQLDKDIYHILIKQSHLLTPISVL